MFSSRNFRLLFALAMGGGAQTPLSLFDLSVFLVPGPGRNLAWLDECSFLLARSDVVFYSFARCLYQVFAITFGEKSSSGCGHEQARADGM